MHYLFLSIICSSAVLVIFRLTSDRGINTNHSIVVSYAASAGAATLLLPVKLDTLLSVWLAVAALQGIAFYWIFQLMARSASESGVAFTSVASKMSVVIPVSIGFLFLGESTNATILIGVLCGFLSVLMSVSGAATPASWRWPVLVFIGSGLIDASFKLFQVWGLASTEFPGFITSIFFCAFLAGIAHHFFIRQSPFSLASAAAGIPLGIANLGTVYFLLSALAIPEFDSAFVYALNSFGIVSLSTIAGLVLFREHLSTKGWLALLLAVISIGLLYLGWVE